MKRIFLAGAAALALTATAALAQSVADQIVSGLQQQGYTRIEVTEGPTQIKVEAIQGSTKLEYVYDRASGRILKQEVEPVRPGEDTTPGVRVRSGDDSVRGDDDGPLHDVGDDHGGDRDDDDDDDSGRRGGSDDDDDSGSGRSEDDDDSDDDSSGSGRGGSGSDDDDDGDDDNSGSGSGGSDDDDDDSADDDDDSGDEDDSDDDNGSGGGSDDD